MRLGLSVLALSFSFSGAAFADAELTGNQILVKADTQLQIPYVQWGMKNPSTLMLRVSDKVAVRVVTRIAMGATRSAL